MATKAKRTIETTIEMIEGSGNIFEDLGFEGEEAALLLLRAELFVALAKHIKAKGWNQREAAKRLGIHQPRVSALMKGKTEDFSIDSLVTLAYRAGLRTSIAVAPAPKKKKAA